MSEEMKAFLKKVSGDESVKSRFSELKNPGQVLEFAKELGFELTEADYCTDEIGEAEEISDSELELVSGGRTTGFEEMIRKELDELFMEDIIMQDDEVKPVDIRKRLAVPEPEFFYE